MDSRIIERVMRMGIEHRSGIALNDLYDLAQKQIKNSIKADKKSRTPNYSLKQWFDQQCNTFGCMFAFAYNNSKLEIIKVVDMTKIKLVEWRSHTMPLVEILK